EKKTWLNSFLGNEITHPDDVKQNNILQPAFELYKLNQNNEAKIKFREISNEAYKKQDYLNYMISEFNVTNIKFDIFKEEPEIPQSIVNTELREVIDKIINNSNNDTKKYATYFRDTILNFNFIYKK
ncbi:TPA: SIR2 family protein, partial [Enterococcus faecium]